MNQILVYHSNVCYFAHLIRLICIDSLPVTGNRQGKIITNKPNRTGQSDKSDRLLQHQKTECICRAGWNLRFILTAGRCLNPAFLFKAWSSYSWPHYVLYTFIFAISSLPEKWWIENILCMSTVKTNSYLKPVAEWRERLIGRCFPVVTLICRITGKEFNKD